MFSFYVRTSLTIIKKQLTSTQTQPLVESAGDQPIFSEKEEGNPHVEFPWDHAQDRNERLAQKCEDIDLGTKSFKISAIQTDN